MGVQASTVKNAAGESFSDRQKKGTKREKGKIGILSFEVASVMAKSVQLWQSLSDEDVHRFRAEVMKSDGVLKLVSNNESVLLSLACLEKLQDLAAVAIAVSRLGKRCHDPALVGFEHIFNDILKQTIDVQELEYSHKQMEAKLKKMERYIDATLNMYQELEILAEMEQAIKRLRDEEDPEQKEHLLALEQKVVWQKQEVKYSKECSLWNRTHDKMVGLLAKTVCTVYGKIIRVFGFPIMGWPQLLTWRGDQEADHSGSITSCYSTEEPKLSNDSMNMNGCVSPIFPGPAHDLSVGSSLSGTPFHDSFVSRSMETSGCLAPSIGAVSRARSRAATKLHFDPKVKLQNAPLSTLGGAGLALHYANVIVIAEKMAVYPDLINQDARDALYHMLPKNVQMALRARLRPCVGMCSSPGYEVSGLAEWKEHLERVLGWLAPLAHNMIRWQSEHNFEQQQLTPRTNVLLLQTLYFADQFKAEAAVTDLLVCLNHLWRHERNCKTHFLMDFSSNKDLNEYLEWQL